MADKWAAYGCLAVGCDALLTCGCVLFLSISLATSAAARGVEPPPDCSELVDPRRWEVRVGQGGFGQSDGSFTCFFVGAIFMTIAAVDRFFAGSCRVLPLAQQLYHEPHRLTSACLFRYYRRALAALWPVYLNAAALDGAYWTAISITLPFHPVFSPPVARAWACTIGGSAVDSTVANFLVGLGVLTGCVRLLYALAILSETFGTHLLAAARTLPSALLHAGLVLVLWLLGCAAAITATFGSELPPSAADGDADAADAASPSARWWRQGLGGALRGLGMLLFGEFDFDDLLGSALPGFSALVFAVFAVGLVALGVNCALAALATDHAARYDEARDRQAWLRAANVYRAESGFLGGALKYAQLRAVRCSRSVPQGYALTDVLRPGAYCRPTPAKPHATPTLDTSDLDDLDEGRWEVEEAAGRRQLPARTWCLVMLHEESSEADEALPALLMHAAALSSSGSGRRGAHVSSAAAAAAVAASAMSPRGHAPSPSPHGIGAGGFHGKGGSLVVAVPPPTPGGLAALSPGTLPPASPWAALAFASSPLPTAAADGVGSSGRWGKAPPASASAHGSARLSGGGWPRGLSPLEEASPSWETLHAPTPPNAPATDGSRATSAAVAPQAPQAAALEAVVLHNATPAHHATPSQAPLAQTTPSHATPAPRPHAAETTPEPGNGAVLTSCGLTPTHRFCPAAINAPGGRAAAPPPRLALAPPSDSPWQRLPSSAGAAERASSPRAVAVAQRMQLSAPSPVILSVGRSTSSVAPSRMERTFVAKRWAGGATEGLEQHPASVTTPGSRRSTNPTLFTV